MAIQRAVQKHNSLEETKTEGGAKPEHSKHIIFRASQPLPEVFGEFVCGFFFAELKRVHRGGEQRFELGAVQVGQREQIHVRDDVVVRVHLFVHILGQNPG